VGVRGRSLWCETEGEGEPLVLIAGGPGASHDYLHALEPLARDTRLIYFDAFGCGKSARASAPGEYGFEQQVADLEALRLALGVSRWNVLGHSYGGAVAQCYALRHPGGIGKLILANTYHSAEMLQAGFESLNRAIRDQHPEMWSRIRAVRARGILSSALEHQLAYAPPLELAYFYDGSNAAKTWVDINPDVFYAIMGVDGDFSVGGGHEQIDFRGRLAELKMPTLIVAGRYDRIVLPRHSLGFQRAAPAAELVMFERSGHLPFLEEPERWFALLRRFLKG
jgi:proline iminopeptidase